MAGKKDSRSNYILVLDLESRIRLFRHIGIKTPGTDDSFFKDFGTDLVKQIKSALPKVNVMAINMDELADEILTKAIEKRSLLKNAIVV